MATKKIRYLLEERGRYYYQRKVPKDLIHALKMDRWHLPVGSDFETATDKIKELKKEHDTLIAQVKADPSVLVTLRREGEARALAKVEKEERPLQEFMDGVRRGDIDCYAARAELAYQEFLAEEAGPAWKRTPDFLHDLQENRKPSVEANFKGTRKPSKGPVTLKEFQTAIARFENIAPPEYFERCKKIFVGSESDFYFVEIAAISDDEYSDRLSDLLKQNFSKDSEPTDEDELLEFDVFKMRLERLIARYAPTPDKLSNVFERFLQFNNIKTEAKYRRVFNRFIAHAHDIPISQVTPKILREYRNGLLADGLSIASVKAAFTPIKSLFRFALDEEIVDSNPTQSVTFPKDNRPIGETKHLAFEPSEVCRILNTIDALWLSPFPYLDDERRVAIRHIVRALAFTAARPVELMSLEPNDVTNDAINIRRTKTKSSWRYVPVHPEISDFPNFVRGGGIKCLLTNNQDVVEPVRHNFMRVLRELMEPAIPEPRKTLYSFRGTFQDAMRRAGAPLEVRQAILGHTQGGAIKHYNSGPEFELMRDWVHKSDPRT